jgi:hypothetical protein
MAGETGCGETLPYVTIAVLWPSGNDGISQGIWQCYKILWSRYGRRFLKQGTGYMNGCFRGPSLSTRLIAIFLLLGGAAAIAETQQEHVHQMAHGVMPFDISKVLHIFRMTESGGVLRVIARDPGAADQVALIQQHLRHEAGQFEKGNYSDPSALHGANMPGLKDLEQGASDIKISYTALPDGAEITFGTKDLHLLTAIHRWFGAQLSEHGADASSE